MGYIWPVLLNSNSNENQYQKFFFKLTGIKYYSFDGVKGHKKQFQIHRQWGRRLKKFSAKANFATPLYWGCLPDHHFYQRLHPPTPHPRLVLRVALRLGCVIALHACRGAWVRGGPEVAMLGTGSGGDGDRNGSWSDRNRRVTERARPTTGVYSSVCLFNDAATS